MYYTGARIVVMDISVADGICRFAIRINIIQRRMPHDTIFYVNWVRPTFCIDGNAANRSTRMRRCIIGNGAIDNAARGDGLGPTPDKNAAN